MTTGKPDHDADDASIEELLREVGAREDPAPSARQDAYATLHAEWRALVAERGGSRRRRAWRLAASLAGLVLVAALAVQLLFLPGRELGTIVHVDGALLAAEGDRPFSMRAVGEALRPGETLRTDDRTRAALRLGEDLSLRLDRGTTVVLAAQDRVVLRSGAVYVDSHRRAAPEASLEVSTPFADVRHVGSQYEVRAGRAAVRVSVREGHVIIESEALATTGSAGEAIRVGAAGDVERTTVSPRDPLWEWAIEAGPPFDIEGATLAAFLQWFARESGHRLVYASAQAESAARSAVLRGSIAELDLQTALTSVLASTRLQRLDTSDGSVLIALDAAD